MFSTKSIFDNMKIGFSKNQIQNKENENNETEEQVVGIKSETNSNSL